MIGSLSSHQVTGRPTPTPVSISIRDSHGRVNIIPTISAKHRPAGSPGGDNSDRADAAECHFEVSEKVATPDALPPSRSKAYSTRSGAALVPKLMDVVGVVVGLPRVCW